MGFDPSPIDSDTLRIRLSDVAATLSFCWLFPMVGWLQTRFSLAFVG